MSGPGYCASIEMPSAEELKQIEEIRSACAAEINALTCRDLDIVGDLRICRFLRARHGDLDQAKEWFKEFLQWRVDSGMDTARKEVVGRSPEDFLQWYEKRRNPHFEMCPWAGRNEDGHIVWFSHPGYADSTKFINERQITLEEDLRITSLVLEWTLWKLDCLSREENRMLYCVKISDLAGLGADGRRVGVFVPGYIPYLKVMLKAMQKNYCEHDTLFVMVNTSWTFRTAWSLVKHLLTKRQQSKFQILGDSKTSEVREVLSGIVPARMMPAEYGGPVQRMVGFLPVMSPEEMDKWYKTRHLVPTEIFSPEGDGGNEDLGDYDCDPVEIVEVSV